VPTILIHGAGEMTERILEGDGHDAAKVLASGHPSGALEMAMRRENKHITLTLTDHGVSSVGFVGSDRGILRWSSSELQARLTLLANSARIGVVPVLGSLALEESASGEVGGKLARRAPPTLAEIIDAAQKQTDFPSFWVGWLVPEAARTPVSRGNVREWSGEGYLPEAPKERCLSIRVLGVSEVSQGQQDAGVELES